MSDSVLALQQHPQLAFELAQDRFGLGFLVRGQALEFERVAKDRVSTPTVSRQRLRSGVPRVEYFLRSFIRAEVKRSLQPSEFARLRVIGQQLAKRLNVDILALSHANLQRSCGQGRAVLTHRSGPHFPSKSADSAQGKPAHRSMFL
jgi:hypothetical protein